MGVFGRLKNPLGRSDKYSDIVIQKEYRGCLHIMGLYPNVNKVGIFWGTARAVVICILLFLHAIGLVVSTVLLYNINFIFFVTSLHYAFIVGLSCLYVFHFNLNRSNFAKFHIQMYFNFYDYHEETTPEITEVVKKEKKQKVMYVLLPLFTAFGAACTLFLAPILDKYGTFDFDIETSINFNLPYPMVYAFDSSAGVGYMVALIHQLFGSLLCGAVLGGTGYSYIVTASAITVQMRILIKKLDSLESRAVSLYKIRYDSNPPLNDDDLYRDEKFASCLETCMRSCVEHHQIILSYVSELMVFHSTPVFSVFLVAGLIIALAMLGSNNWKVLPGNTFVSLMLCLIELAFIFVVATLGQTITDLNEDIRESLYGIKWYLCKKGFCLNILILLSKTLKPLTFTVFGLININHYTYANIINSAYSYYNLAAATASQSG